MRSLVETGWHQPQPADPHLHAALVDRTQAREVRFDEWQRDLGHAAIPPPSWNKFVAFDNAKMRNSTWTRVIALLVKHNAQLGDTYGLSADELAKLMKQWRNLAVAARPR